ncbi:DMT family transporter [Streptomyces spiralis]
MTGMTGSTGVGSLCVLLASVLWGTTGTAATFAPDVGPLAIGAVAMGCGGLLQALVAVPRIRREAPALRRRRGVVLLGGAAVGAYPLAFYSSMHLAGVAAGTVVSIGSAPLASALVERVMDGRRLTRRWTAGAALGLTGTVLLCAAESAGAHSGPATRSTGSIVLGVGLGLVAGLTYALYSWAAHRLISRGVSSATRSTRTTGADRVHGPTPAPRPVSVEVHSCNGPCSGLGSADRLLMSPWVRHRGPASPRPALVRRSVNVSAGCSWTARSGAPAAASPCLGTHADAVPECPHGGTAARPGRHTTYGDRKPADAPQTDLVSPPSTRRFCPVI